MSDERDTPDTSPEVAEGDTGSFRLPPPRPETSEMDALEPTAVESDEPPAPVDEEPAPVDVVDEPEPAEPTRTPQPVEPDPEAEPAEPVAPEPLPEPVAPIPVPPEPLPGGAETPPRPAFDPVGAPDGGGGAAAVADEHPEILVGGAFVGGLSIAMLLKRLVS